MSITAKQRLLGVLRAFNYVGLVLLLFLTINILVQIKSQAIQNHDDTAAAVEQIQRDHDLQNRYLQCLVNLFIESDSDTVTPDQSALCLAKVRDATTKTTTIAPTKANGDTTTTTTTTQSRPEGPAGTAAAPVTPQREPQTTPVAPQTTTSAPPDPPASPSVLEQVIAPVKGLLKL